MEGPAEEKGRTSLPDCGAEIEAERSVSLVSKGGPRGPGRGSELGPRVLAQDAFPYMCLSVVLIPVCSSLAAGGEALRDPCEAGCSACKAVLIPEDPLRGFQCSWHLFPSV